MSLEETAFAMTVDNALAEAFNATLKREVLQGRRTFANALEARIQVEAWIRGYNTVRRHSSLGQASPIDYERQRANLARTA